jgi:hypothetical protein
MLCPAPASGKTGDTNLDYRTRMIFSFTSTAILGGRPASLEAAPL